MYPHQKAKSSDVTVNSDFCELHVRIMLTEILLGRYGYLDQCQKT